ncbi:MAG: AFG1 family ATPase [Granulosicoccus sp.]|nr:AFG1 family ATPase [Granulosicoccus sp.]
MPLKRYEEEIQSGVLQPDLEQHAIMRKLSLISDELQRRKSWRPPSRSLFARWIKPSDQTVTGIRGLYLWGGVGRGKTHLCDLFFDSVPIEDKTRLHFHRFMQHIHDDLKQLDNIDEPLIRISDEWAKRARLLLLDEIHVNDITDAMLLGGLLTALFKRGVTLVTTSNVAPDDLYKDGLQRARFLPAIAQIIKHTDVIEMHGDTDYRLRVMQKEPIYIVGQYTNGVADVATMQTMQNHFDSLSSDLIYPDKSVVINSRKLPVVAQSTDVVWFSFDTLCNTERSTHDYIELATLYHTIMLSDVPIMGNHSDDAARRFVNLIDEFYDRGVKMIISAHAPSDSLYTGKRLAFEFERAASRLIEMQTTEYLSASPPRVGPQ